MGERRSHLHPLGAACASLHDRGGNLSIQAASIAKQAARLDSPVPLLWRLATSPTPNVTTANIQASRRSSGGATYAGRADLMEIHKHPLPSPNMALPGLRALMSSRLTPPLNPFGVLKLARDFLRYGPSPAIGYAGGAARHATEIAVIDVDGHRITFAEAEDLTRMCVAGLAARGVAQDSAVAVLGRNSLGFALAIPAVARIGADLVYLNPGFRPAQVESIINDRSVSFVLVDDDLRDRVPINTPKASLSAPDTWASKSPKSGGSRSGRHIILTSGTTGTPKGADRSSTPMESAISLLDALPYRERDTHILAAPMFHSWGWLNHRLTALLDATEVMISRPNAAAVLDAAAEHQAEIIVATPVVVRRLADAGPGERDLSQLRGVLVSGSAIPAPVVKSFGEQFGPILFNLYGSTEVGFATCASPDDLAADANTAGRSLPGVKVAVLTPEGQPLPIGAIGEIWVGSAASFDGYVDGGDKDRRSGLLSTGDLGRFDANGRLFVSGRADDLIISGGENVHPAEVEAVLRGHHQVQDVAAVGRSDPKFGQAVVAYVVPQPGAVATTQSDALIAELHRFCDTELARYQRPRDIFLRDSLPTNETGKVLRRDL
jgi:acyl-CoA synthetase (AMP-forming)/AMP-acid ligase II